LIDGFNTFAGMMFFVFIGCGAAVGFSTPRISTFAEDANTLSGEEVDTTTALRNLEERLLNSITINSSFGIATAMAFGMGIMTIVYALGHVSGGHFNPAVTFSLFLSGNCPLLQALGNILAQIIGAILGAALLYGMTPDAANSSLGANSVSPGFHPTEALLGEIVATALLCFVVHMTGCDKHNTIGSLAPLAIGFAVFLGHRNIDRKDPAIRTVSTHRKHTHKKNICGDGGR
jgi:glycerol uptake facilitator-like aquaporin